MSAYCKKPICVKKPDKTFKRNTKHMQANVEVPLPLATNKEASTTKAVPGQVKKETTGSDAAAAHPDCPEDLTSNAAHIDGGASEQEMDNRNKARRYWSAFEEERFFEVWGRDNWLLTRHGKNTVFFAKWADELRDIHGIDIKPEEIQAKVNQTRAKFRSVKKAMIAEGMTTARWKKYTLIDNILKNQYRSEDADPIPKEALERNRDMTPPPTKTMSSRHKSGESIMSSVPAAATPTSVVTTPAEQLSLENSISSEHNISTAYFNSADVQPTRLGYNSELFTDAYDDIKQEYDDPTFRSRQPYEQMQSDDPNADNYIPAEEVQLHELQTPLQLQQQQQQQHFQQQQPAPPQSQYPSHQPSQHLNTYEQPSQSYAGSEQASPMAMHTNTNNTTEYNNNGSNISANSVDFAKQPHSTNSSSTALAIVTTNGNSMQPPGRTPLTGAQTSSALRKRGRPFGTAAGGIIPGDSLEAIYLVEVRRKNQILDDQLKISQRRLELEERKIELMTQFFPKCIELQTLILAKLQSN